MKRCLNRALFPPSGTGAETLKEIPNDYVNQSDPPNNIAK